MGCKKDENEKSCACKDTDCERHGICCDCVRYHRKAGNLPKCLRKNTADGK